MQCPVAVIPCDDYQPLLIENAFKEGFKYIGNWKNQIKPGTKVFLKLNLLMKKRPDEAVTIHPSVVEQAVKELQNLGAVVTIGDSPGGPFTKSSLRAIYKVCGIEEVAQKTGAKLNFNTDEIQVLCKEGKIMRSFTMCKAMVESDVIVSISKMKTHMMTRFTGAVKVMFGAIPGLQKAEYHLKMPKVEDFADMLIDINFAIKPVVHIMDAVVGMEGKGPSGGEPKKVGALLFSENPFALDYIAVKLMGLNPDGIPTVKRANERKIIEPQAIPVLGSSLEQWKIKPFKAPKISGQVNFPIPHFFSQYLRPKPEFHTNKCTRCGDCVRLCPPQALTLKNKVPELNTKDCIRCFCCQELCPKKAVDVKRTVIGKLLRY